jgi:hypothetical protein
MPRNALMDSVMAGVSMPISTDPYDYTSQFNTELPPALEAQFQRWLKQSGRNDAYDYDIRGAWLSATQGNPETQWLVGVGRPESRGHLPDTWKKPNHPTFSSGSQYQSEGVTGGEWQPRDAEQTQWNYLASPHNMRMQEQPNALRKYFQQVEQRNTLVEPAWGMMRK